MDRQYNTIWYNTVLKEIPVVQIHLLRNNNNIRVIENSVSNIISRCAKKNSKLTMQPHALIRSTKNVKASFRNMIIQSTYL